ncbi:MAG: class II aldolase/adducin family protein [Anaerolineae bacterium]|nr:class II aldolase/adducin family protein [Anaerolineae bacterium]
MMDNDLRREIADVCHLMHAKDFVAATDGNVSARLRDGSILCTPNNLSKGLVRPEDLLVVDMDGQPVGPRYGPARLRKPSSEIRLHIEAYKQRPDIKAVVHAHPPVAIALSIAGVSLARCLLPEVIVTLGLIPTLPYAFPASAESAALITEPIKRYDVLMLERHGSVTVGNSVMEAYLKLEKVEHTAQITLTLLQLGKEKPFPPSEAGRLARLRQARGLMKEGEAEDLCKSCGICDLLGGCPIGEGEQKQGGY